MSSPRTLRSLQLGLTKSVTLYETHLVTPSGSRPLTPDLQATVEQHGTKQVVQGWVFKSDHDRRELYLHLRAAGWSEVVAISPQRSPVRPDGVHQFANGVNTAASESRELTRHVAERRRAAAESVRTALGTPVAVTKARATLLQTATQYPAIRAARARLEQLYGADPDQRRAHDAYERAVRITEAVNRLEGEASAELERLAKTIRVAGSEAQGLERRPPSATASQPAEADEVELHLRSPGDRPIHVIKVLREFTGDGLKHAKAIVDSAPCSIGTFDSAFAEAMAAQLRAVGALVDEARVPPTDANASPIEATMPDAAETVGQLERLSTLRDSGAITDEEFQALKARLLAGGR
jgi:large subunit ribosomal protein L7/L12